MAISFFEYQRSSQDTRSFEFRSITYRAYQALKMLGVRSSIVGLSIALSGCGELTAQNKESGVLKIEMSVSDSQLQNGSVVLKSTLVNSTGQKITFLPWNTPYGAAVNGRFLKVVEHVDGSEDIELSYMGLMVKRRQAVAADYLSLGIGEVMENTLDITKNYNFCQNRLYSISFAGDLFDLNHKAIPVHPSVAKVAKFTTGSAFSRCDRD